MTPRDGHSLPGAMAYHAPQRSSRTTAGSTASGGPPTSGPRSGGSSGGLAGTTSHSEVSLAAGEDRVELVLCPPRDAPALENVAASDPVLEKASDGRHGRINHGGE
jgi:hypothetical protein